ncbi:bifunctional coenzyme A synthase [Pezoporus wallicus]|uniref:bifunctional coenzyme A synthase n=1 Tax=Pezoporus wallicus TaxID=35540 RepID=UPI002549EA75|nr:bifunctional coenzyme A synthase [Pezoporus wallicus]XP_061333537.1 bifunctional coenzyme A synthase [Pezoporus flaviventris]
MPPFGSGLLVLTAPLAALPRRAAAALAAAAGLVAGPLYVHLQPGLRLAAAPPPLPAAPPPAGPALLRALAALYAAAARRGMDVRVLLDPGRRLARPPRVLLLPANEAPGPPGPVQLGLQSLATAAYGCAPDLPALLLGDPAGDLDGDPKEDPECGPDAALPNFSGVAVGGTFDRLHGAHRLLLSTCCLLARDRLLAGVADGDLLRHKVLMELIEPYELRVAKLREFLEDVKPSLRYDIVRLIDPYGPSVTDPDLQCLVVSQESRRGGEAVNQLRLENGLPALALYEILLMQDPDHSENEEEKISSSSLRHRLLGTLLRPPRQDPALPSHPYVIGLTGGTGSGKTSIARLLGGLGAFLIDADKLGHAVYVPGGPAYKQVVATFGAEILSEDGTINRKVLGAKVFGNQERLKSLTDIVWPKIARLVKEQIREAEAQGKAVCVLDAAVLLEAGWQDMVHEVWTAVIPEDEAVRRVMARDGLSEEAARSRLRSQMSNGQRVERAHVVLCTLWEPDITRKQVEKAWELLQQRLPQARSP